MADTRTAAPVTAASVTDGALHPAMDATAAGMAEQRLLHCPETPEADSIVELLVASADIQQRLAEKVVELAAVNGVQLHFDRHVGGWADRLVTALRDAELNGTQAAAASRIPTSGRRLAHELMHMLDALDTPPPGRARAQLHEIFAGLPFDQIFRQAVYDHLGARRRPVLIDEYTRWQQARGRS